ncbi:MAG: hypothetical protein NUV77_05740, partial [Thermoguttaceae bacterium]|nr:hypothetical protein [Thermoguttaceae bacterium]
MFTRQVEARPAVRLAAVMMLATVLMSLGSAFAQRSDRPSPTVAAPSDVFALAGTQSILEEAHCGIVNGKLTVGVPFKDVFRI